AILRQDPSLEPAASSVPGSASEDAGGGPIQRRSSRTLVLSAATAVALAAAALLALALSGNGQRRVDLAADAVGVVRDGRLADQGGLSVAPSAIAAGAGGVWVPSASANSVSRLDEKTFDLRQTIAGGDGPSGVASGRGGVGA